MAFEQNRRLQQLVDPLTQGAQRLLNQNTRTGGIQNSSFPAQQNNQFVPMQPMQPQPVNFVESEPNQSWYDWFRNLLVGTPARQGVSSNFTPFQQQGFQALQNMGQYNMQNPYQGFDELQNGVADLYNQRVLPTILSRLGNSALSSPDLAKHFRMSGEGLASQLLQHKLNYGQNNRQFGLQQAQLGLTPQYQQNYIPAQGGLLQNLLPIVGNLAGAGYFNSTPTTNNQNRNQ